MEWDDLKSASGVVPSQSKALDKKEYLGRIAVATFGNLENNGVADAFVSKTKTVNDIARMLCSIQSQYELSPADYSNLPKALKNGFTFAANSLYEDIVGGKIVYQRLLDAYAELINDEKYRRFTCSAVTIASDLARCATKKIEEDWKGDFVEQRRSVYGF